MTDYKWIRTCQECSHKQEDKEPVYGADLSQVYEMRKCKKCKSESLDYGSAIYNESDFVESDNPFGLHKRNELD